MIKVGMGYANVDAPRGLNDLYSLDLGALVVLDQQRNRLPELRARYTDALIEIRFYPDNWFTTDPRRWAEQIADVYKRDIRQYTNHLTFANEQNLRDEGHPLAIGYVRRGRLWQLLRRVGLVKLTRLHPRNVPAPWWSFDHRHYDDWVVARARSPYLYPRPTDRTYLTLENMYPPRKVYEDIRDWNLIVIQELRRLCPDAILHFPALSQGHSDDQDDAGYVGFEILRKVVEACDYLDVHTYWNGEANRESIYYGRRYEKVRALFPSKPLFISECGSDVDMRNDDGRDYGLWLDGVPDSIQGRCFFIWDSDSNNAGWTIWNKSRIVKALKEYKPMPIPVPTISDNELAKLVVSVGFAPLETAATAMAVILAESGGNPNAVNVNHSPGKPWDLSKDQGLVQFNRYWFWESKGNRRVSDWVAFNPIAAITSFYWATSQGKSFNQWSTYKAGAHVKYLDRCRKAVANV